MANNLNWMESVGFLLVGIFIGIVLLFATFIIEDSLMPYKNRSRRRAFLRWQWFFFQKNYPLGSGPGPSTITFGTILLRVMRMGVVIWVILWVVFIVAQFF